MKQGSFKKNRYYTVCFYFLLVESFVLRNYIEFNVSTSIFLIGIGIQDYICDMWLQSVAVGWFKQNYVLPTHFIFIQYLIVAYETQIGLHVGIVTYLSWCTYIGVP